MAMLNARTQQLGASYIAKNAGENRKRPGSRLDCPTVPRQRKSVTQLHRELGKTYFRRSFRMKYSTFGQLFQVIKSDLARIVDSKNQNKSPNGRVTLTIRFGCAIRFFAGGDAYDVACMFGVSHSVVFESVDYVIDAINECDALKIEFPSDHAKQRKIADGFLKKSPHARIACCGGCIDGILIWTHKPSKEECDRVGVSESKFFCGRKHKFGLNLNMQAICNHKKQFTSISILYGAASSDLMAFEVSDIRQKLGQPGFLADGLCLFGDNAYINTKFMATPYPNIGNNMQKDAYNFFHSQVRITVEGAFGLLTQRWGFLRKQAPKKYTISKTMAAVESMCRLHNYLIEIGAENCPQTHSEEDEWSMAVNGAVPFALREGIRVPMQLMDAGHHQEDDPTRQRRNRTRDNAILPREAIFRNVYEKNLRRPVPRRR